MSHSCGPLGTSGPVQQFQIVRLIPLITRPQQNSFALPDIDTPWTVLVAGRSGHLIWEEQPSEDLSSIVRNENEDERGGGKHGVTLATGTPGTPEDTESLVDTPYNPHDTPFAGTATGRCPLVDEGSVGVAASVTARAWWFPLRTAARLPSLSVVTTVLKFGPLGQTQDSSLLVFVLWLFCAYRAEVVGESTIVCPAYAYIIHYNILIY